MLENVEWGEFKLGGDEGLFDIVGTKSLDSNAVEFQEKGINFIGRTFENNGIQGKILKQNFAPNKPFTITATVIGNYKYVKYQKEQYYCSQNINKLTPNKIITKWNEKIAYYFIASIQKFVSLYDGQQGGYKLEDIKNHKVKIPIKNNQIDFEFMENFIAELEKNYVIELEIKQKKELEAYLSVSGLKNYELTEEEKRVLEDFENNKIEFDSFKIGELLKWQPQIEIDVLNLKTLRVEDGNIKYPFYGQSTINNGIISYESLIENVLNNKQEKPTILIHSNNQNSVYLETSFYLKNGHGATSVLQSNYLNKLNALFIKTCISKVIVKKFSYQYKATKIALKNTIIELPIDKNNQPDYKTMEIFISAIQKLVIKDVVLYSEKKLNTTKKVVNENNN